MLLAGIVPDTDRCSNLISLVIAFLFLARPLVSVFFFFAIALVSIGSQGDFGVWNGNGNFILFYFIFAFRFGSLGYRFGNEARILFLFSFSPLLDFDLDFPSFFLFCRI